MFASSPLYLLIDGFIGSIARVPFRSLQLLLLLGDAVGGDGGVGALAGLSRRRHGGGPVASAGHGGRRSERRGCHRCHET